MNPTELDTSRDLLNRAKNLGVTGSGVDALSNVISSDTLTGDAQPIQLPETKVSTLADGILGKSAGLLELDQLQQQAVKDQADKEAKLKEAGSQKQSILEKIGLVKGSQEQLQQDAGVNELQNTARRAANDLLVSQRAQENELRALESSNMTDSGRASAQRDINRKYAFEQADLQLSYHLANSDLNAAQTVINDKIALQLEPLYEELDLQKEVYGQLSDSLSKSEDRVWQAAMSKTEQSIKETQDLEKYKGDIAIQASQNGVPLPSYVQQQLNRAKNQAEVNQVLADNGVSLVKPVVGTGVGGNSDQLYAGLASSTSTAVRAKVAKFATEPSVQNFATIQEGYNFAQSLANDTQNPADDQALIYSLAKALDPGSVVREGEYATAQKYAQSWVKAYGKGVSQAILGTGFLSQEARENIKKTIETKFNASKKSYDNLYNQYSTGINSLTGRGDGTSFLTDYAIPQEQVGTPPPVDVSKGEISGLTVTFPGGGTLTFPDQNSLNLYKKDNGL